MPPKVDPSQITAEFGHELEAERQQLLRRRFLWYTGTVAGFSAIFLLPSILGIALDHSLYSWIRLLLNSAVFTCYAVAFIYVLYRQNTRWPIIKMCLALIVISGMLSLMGGRSALGQFEDVTTPVKKVASANRKKKITQDIVSNLPSASPTDVQHDATATPGTISGAITPSPTSVGTSAPETTSASLPPADTSLDLGSDPESDPGAINLDPSEEAVGAVIPTPGMPGAIQISKKDTDAIRAWSAFGAGLSGAYSIFLSHFLACL